MNSIDQCLMWVLFLAGDCIVFGVNLFLVKPQHGIVNLTIEHI